MGSLVPVLLALVAQAERPALAAGEVLELTLPAVPGTRTEHFRLDLPAAPAAPAPDGSAAPASAAPPPPPAPPAGLLRLHFAVDPRSGYRLESDALWIAERTRVVDVARLKRDELGCLRREIGPRHARSTLFRWRKAEAEIEVVDRTATEEVRRTLAVDGGALLPLYLLEKARTGASDGTFPAIDLASAAVERLHQVTRPLPGPLATLRLVEWRRADGTLAGRYLFAGTSLLALQLQAGGAVGVRIPAEEHARLAGEAAAAAAPGDPDDPGALGALGVLGPLGPRVPGRIAQGAQAHPAAPAARASR